MTDINSKLPPSHKERVEEARELADDIKSGRWLFEKGNARLAEAQDDALSANSEVGTKAGKAGKAHASGGESKTLDTQAALTDTSADDDTDIKSILAETSGSMLSRSGGKSDEPKLSAFGGSGDGVTPDILPG